MSQRDRSLIMVVVTVGGFIVLAGGFLGLKSLWDHLKGKDDEIARLESDVQSKQLEELVLMKAKQKWDRWQAISLPPDAATANNQYKGYLQELTRRHKLDLKKLTDGGTRASVGAGAGLTPLPYTLQAQGTLGQFISFMKEFYSINLPHQVKDITLTPTPRGTGVDAVLEATIKLEALSLANIPNRDFLPAIPNDKVLRWDVIAGLLQAPTGLSVGLWSLTPVGLFGGESKLAAEAIPSRDYMQLVNKNVFVGLAPAAVVAAKTPAGAEKDVLKFVRLTDILVNEKGSEAGLYNQRVNKQIRLRCEDGKDTFTVRDSNDQVILNGKVKQINPRDMIIAVDGKHYAVHVGDNLQDAMKKELKEEPPKTAAAG